MLQFILGFLVCIILFTILKYWENKKNQLTINEIMKAKQNLKLLTEEAIQVSNLLTEDLEEKINEGKDLIEKLDKLIINSKRNNFDIQESSSKKIKQKEKKIKSKKAEKDYNGDFNGINRFENLFELKLEGKTTKEIAQHYNMGQDEVEMILGLIDKKRKLAN